MSLDNEERKLNKLKTKRRRAELELMATLTEVRSDLADIDKQLADIRQLRREAVLRTVRRAT